MNSQKKIIHFRLNAETIEKLKTQKGLLIECIKSGFGILLNDTRININVNKTNKTPNAIYYETNNSDLHFLGESSSGSATFTKIEPKPIESNIPTLDNKTQSPLSPLIKPIIKPISSPLLKSNIINPSIKQPQTSLNNTNTNIINQNIPSPTIKQKKLSTSKPTKQSNSLQQPTSPLTKPKPSTRVNQKQSSKVIQKTIEQKYSLKTRILQRLALHPWSVNEIIKSINRTQNEKCDQLEVKHILETVAIPIKKGERHKYCLKPNFYKEIQIWDWPYYSLADKEIAKANAIEAYDLLQSKGVEIDRKNIYGSSPISTPTSSQVPSVPIKKLDVIKSTEKPKALSPVMNPSLLSPKSIKPIKKPNSPYEKPLKTPIEKLPIQSPLSHHSPLSKPLMKQSTKRKAEDELENVQKKSSPIRSKPSKKTIPVVPKPSTEPIDIPTQRQFEAYCHKYNKAQREYIRIKRFLKINFSDYIQVLEKTEQPQGSKRSYYDLNLEYFELIRQNYLKRPNTTKTTLKEAEQVLEDCNHKRRRLKYMWSSIKQNLEEHQYKIPKSAIEQ